MMLRILYITALVLSINFIVNDKIYRVSKIETNIDEISGKGNDPAWKNVEAINDFVYPWEDGTPPVTTFKAVHSKDWVYCLFEAEDDNICIFRNNDSKNEVISSDRVEIFLKRHDDSMYYSLEIDPLARVFDSQAEFFKKIDSQWTWPKNQLLIKTHQEKNRYTVEIAISKKSLRELHLIENNELLAGLYRAECIELKERQAKFKWISWVTPNSEKPNFHLPSSFGKLILEDD